MPFPFDVSSHRIFLLLSLSLASFKLEKKLAFMYLHSPSFLNKEIFGFHITRQLEWFNI